MTNTLPTYTIDGVTFRTVAPTPTTNLSFYSQKQLFALGTPEALAELISRVPFVLARKAA